MTALPRARLVVVGGLGGAGATAAPGQHPIDRHALRLKPTGEDGPGKPSHSCPMLRGEPG